MKKCKHEPGDLLKMRTGRGLKSAMQHRTRDLASAPETPLVGQSMDQTRTRLMKRKPAKKVMKKVMAKKPKLGSGKRFAQLTSKLAAKGAKNPKALAASIGTKKFSRAKMSKMALAGKKLRNK